MGESRDLMPESRPTPSYVHRFLVFTYYHTWTTPSTQPNFSSIYPLSLLCSSLPLLFFLLVSGGKSQTYADDMGIGDENTCVCLFALVFPLLLVVLHLSPLRLHINSYSFNLVGPTSRQFTSAGGCATVYNVGSQQIRYECRSHNPTLLRCFFLYPTSSHPFWANQTLRHGHTGDQVSTLWHLLADGWVGAVSSYKGWRHSQLSTIYWHSWVI